MSRSTKHNAVLKLKNIQSFKRLANKRMRKKVITIEHTDNKHHWPDAWIVEYIDTPPSKHQTSSYDICDYRSRPFSKNDSWYNKAKRK